MPSLKTTLSLSFGNIIEWYDFCLFGYFATTISHVFFNHTTQFVGLLATLATVGIGLVARPLGGLLFGYLGDTIGRHEAFNFALFMMCITTFLVAFLPGSQRIGFAAPCLLVLLRIIQGLSAGGQYGNTLVLIREQQPTRSRGLHTGMTYAASVLGFLAASITAEITLTLTPKSIHETLAWRIPFLFSGLFCLLYWKVQHAQTAPVTSTASPIYQQLRQLSKPLLQSTLLSFVGSTLYFCTFTLFITSEVTRGSLTLSHALWINSISLLLLCIAVPFSGWLSDYFGRQRFLIATYLLFLTLFYPCLSATFSPHLLTIFIGSLGFVTLLGFSQGAVAPVFAELFPPPARATACSSSYALGCAVSAFSPALITALSIKAPQHVAIFLFIILSTGLLTALTLKQQLKHA